MRQVFLPYRLAVGRQLDGHEAPLRMGRFPHGEDTALSGGDAVCVRGDAVVLLDGLIQEVIVLRDGTDEVDVLVVLGPGELGVAFLNLALLLLLTGTHLFFRYAVALLAGEARGDVMLPLEGVPVDPGRHIKAAAHVQVVVQERQGLLGGDGLVHVKSVQVVHERSDREHRPVVVADAEDTVQCIEFLGLEVHLIDDEYGVTCDLVFLVQTADGVPYFEVRLVLQDGVDCFGTLEDVLRLGAGAAQSVEELHCLLVDELVRIEEPSHDAVETSLGECFQPGGREVTADAPAGMLKEPVLDPGTLVEYDLMKLAFHLDEEEVFDEPLWKGGLTGRDGVNGGGAVACGVFSDGDTCGDGLDQQFGGFRGDVGEVDFDVVEAGVVYVVVSGLLCREGHGVVPLFIVYTGEGETVRGGASPGAGLRVTGETVVDGLLSVEMEGTRSKDVQQRTEVVVLHGRIECAEEIGAHGLFGDGSDTLLRSGLACGSGLLMDRYGGVIRRHWSERRGRDGDGDDGAGAGGFSAGPRVFEQIEERELFRLPYGDCRHNEWG